MALSEEDRRAQCAEDQRQAYSLMAQVPLIVSKFKKLEAEVEILSGRMDGFDEFKKDFDEFRAHLEKDVITPITETIAIFNTIKSRAPWVILFLIMTGADWDNIPKVLSAIVNAMKLAGV